MATIDFVSQNMLERRGIAAAAIVWLVFVRYVDARYGISQSAHIVHVYSARQ